MAMERIPIARGDIVVVDLRGAVGTEKQNDRTSGTRVCVVVQNDGGNRGSPITIVAPITDAESYRDYPQQVKVTAKEISAIGPITKDSVVECGQLRTIDRVSRIKKNCGPIDAAVIPRIDAALKASLGL